MMNRERIRQIAMEEIEDGATYIEAGLHHIVADRIALRVVEEMSSSSGEKKLIEFTAYETIGIQPMCPIVVDKEGGK